MREDIKINDRALALEKSLIEKLELVFDTDVELDVYNLGLIYEIHLDEAGTCKVVMTFTDTACSCAESLPIEIVSRLKEIDGIEEVKVEVTWSPGKSRASADMAASHSDSHHDKNSVFACIKKTRKLDATFEFFPRFFYLFQLFRLLLL